MKTTKTESINPKLKIVIGALILITPLATMLPYLAMAVLMNDIMASLDIGFALAGLSMTVMLAISGLCMFLGSNIQGKIGIRKTIFISVWLMFLGSAVCFIADNFAIFFLGRIVSGIGFGLMSVSVMPYMSTWFKGNQRTYMITANLIANSLASIVALSIANPISEIFNSWQIVFGIYAAFIAIVALLWMLFGRSNTELEEASKPNPNIVTEKQSSSLRKAFGVKQFRMLTICGIFIMCAITALTTFMPTFLQNERGFTVGFSVMAANVLNATFIVGALAGGFIVAKSGKRKIIFQLGIIIMTLGGLLFAFGGTQVLTIISVTLIGIGFMLRMPAQTTITMETLSPPNPVILGGAMAMISGFGQMISLVVAPAFSMLTDGIGMSGAMQVFFGLLAISVVVSFMVRETGVTASNL